MPPLVPACKRCHIRKIKCDPTKPSCRPCTEARLVCEPHERRRRVLKERDGENVRRRLSWLEGSILRHFAVDLRPVQTGANLGDYLPGPDLLRRLPSASGTYSGELGSSEGPLSSNGSSTMLNECDSEAFSNEMLPDISLLTFNATGEIKYLGPSSGSFFAKYASDFARRLLHNEGNRLSTPARLPMGIQLAKERLISSRACQAEDVTSHLTPSISNYLLSRYSTWVHPLFPLFPPSYVGSVLQPLCMGEFGLLDHPVSGSDDGNVILIIYRLVLALGAAHASPSTSNEAEKGSYLEYQDALSTGKLSPDAIFLNALDLLDRTSHAILPGIALIQIVILLYVYGGYKPSGNGQWQLAGIAIRTAVEIGLHRHRENWKFGPEELELRQRVFWTTYTAEITVAYNLGRPPSIPDEHVDALFPRELPDAVMALHHVRHRQIQSKILAQVYCSPSRLEALSDAEKYRTIQNLQEELDSWKDATTDLFLKSSTSYPLQYWERLYYSTTAALHRPSPLFPKPSPDSAIKSLRAAGYFINIYHYLLKSTDVPQSWMLLQGLLLSGVTVLVTTRSNAHCFLKRDDFEILDVVDWNQKCSNVLNIMSERWSDQSISNLEAKLARLASDTVKMLLALKGNSGSEMHTPSQIRPGDQVQRHVQTGDEMTSSPNIGLVTRGVVSPQGGQWDYQYPPENLPSSATYGNQHNQDDVHFRDGCSQGDDAFREGMTDAFPLESFLGDDDLFSFWDVTPYNSSS